MILFQTTLYALWREHNQRRHGEAATPTSQLIRMVHKPVRNRFAIFMGIYGHVYVLQFDSISQLYIYTGTTELSSLPCDGE